MVAAKDRIRVNCDLRHVTVVLCCDPKAFTHTNPLDGMQPRAAAWSGSPTRKASSAWEHLPLWARKQIIDKNIRVFTLPGFDIAKKATDRGDLQLRMQGNAFLGAFFAVCRLLDEFGITQEQYRDVVHKQYVKKFGKLGDAVVQSNMEVMMQGFDQVKEIKIGVLTAADRSTPARPGAAADSRDCSRRRGRLRHRLPFHAAARRPGRAPAHRQRRHLRRRVPLRTSATTSPPRRSRAMGVIAAATGDTASKYVARRETPLYIPENCTQCMECISVCPDTALPNTSQDLSTLLRTAVTHYVADPADRTQAHRARCRRSRSRPASAWSPKARPARRCPPSSAKSPTQSTASPPQAKQQFFDIIDKVPMAYQKVNAIFSSPERKTPGSGGIFSIFVTRPLQGLRRLRHRLRRSQRPHAWLPKPKKSTPSTMTGTAFLDLLPDTSQKYLGLFNAANPADSKTATLRNMLMVRTNYDALVSGDGACAGCGEKSVLRSIAAVTEAYMRPVFHAKSDRFVAKAGDLEKTGVAQPRRPQGHAAPPNTTSSARPSRISSSASAAKTKTTPRPASPPTKPATAPSPTPSSSRPSPPSCSLRPSTTRTCSPSTAASPTACPSWPWPPTPAATPSTAPPRPTTRTPIRG